MEGKKKDFDGGEVILIDKPLTWTSFDVVKKLKFGLKVKKIGHAGTLDPLATGLLVVCTGKKTKTIESIQAQQKEYVFRMVLGKSTPSVDLETDFDAEAPFEHVNSEVTNNVLQSFLGEQMQVPPLFSAVKVNGKRAYELARSGENAVLNAKLINVYEIELLEFNLPSILIRVICSKGTYVRTLARDIALKLKTLAHISELRRTKIGDFDVTEALKPTDFLAIHGLSGVKKVDEQL
ncbi:MAG: tRNA pseudouridine(55) synthase TruB [Cytophagales bacterium]